MSAILLRLLADASLRVSVVSLLVAAILGVLRVRSSRVRHASWTAVLGAMLLMPLLPYAVPAIAIPISLPRALAPSGASFEPMAARDAGVADDATTGDASSPASAARTAPIAWASPIPTDTSSMRAPFWPFAALVLYGAGILLLSLRCVLGWRAAARIARTGREVDPVRGRVIPVPQARGLTIRESSAVLAPVTVGIFAPTILLPVAWRAWPDDKVRVILAHELAHIERRDSLVSLFAHINRCLFWFHPIAWWLERALAAHAEHASDEVVVRAVGEPRRYAEILLDIARTVREGGGRLSWHAVGIGGNGLLGQRIDRVLGADLTSDPSSLHNIVVAAGCTAAILFAVACRPQPAAPRFDANASIAQRDRTLRAELRRIELRGIDDIAGVDRDVSARRMDALEADVARNPDDLVALKELLLSYWIQPAPEKRRAHILRLIARHPDAPLAGSVEAQLFPGDLSRWFVVDAEPAQPSFPGDPRGYEQAKALWLAHARRPNAGPAVLGNAAYFFETADKPLAEEMLLRARALDPHGSWSARLGRFYATVLVGSKALASKNVMRTISVAEPRSPYGVGARKKLGESSDDELLTATGWFLARTSARPLAGFDPGVWAESCFKRALHVNPQAVLAHTELLRLRARQANDRGEPLWRVAPAFQYDHYSALPEAERFEQLPRLARDAYAAIEDIARWDDPNLRDRLDLARQQAKRYADDALVLASRYRTHPKYGTAIYLANMTLGALALRDGDQKKAVEFLRDASQAPSSEELAYSEGLVSGVHWHLAADLLARGQRDAVTTFLERMAEINIPDRADLRSAAAAIRRGETPRF